MLQVSLAKIVVLNQAVLRLSRRKTAVAFSKNAWSLCSATKWSWNNVSRTCRSSGVRKVYRALLSLVP
jgi:hypothetical protein